MIAAAAGPSPNTPPAPRVARTRGPDDLELRDPARIELFARVAESAVARYHRARIRGVERVPHGAALIVGNHNAGAWAADMFLLGTALYRAHGLEGAPYGLAHEVVLELPWFRKLLMPLGAVRASHENALAIFERGRRVLVYPGGDLESMRPFRDRNRIVFGGRRGYVRLALRAGVPIVPVVAAGAHSTFIVVDDLRWLARALGADRRLRLNVWPLTLCLPWGVMLGPLLPYVPFPSRISMEFLEPIRFEPSGAEAAGDADYVAECDRRVRAAMQSALTRLAAERPLPDTQRALGHAAGPCAPGSHCGCTLARAGGRAARSISERISTRGSA